MRKMIRVKRVALVLGILLVSALSLIGILSLTRGTPVKAVVAIGDHGGPPAVTDSAVRAGRWSCTPVSISRAGTRAQQMLNGVGTYPQLWKDLRAAKRTITVQMYYSQPGEVADTMAAVLKERARAGVRVLFVLDAFGSQNLKEEWADSLRAASVELALLRQLHWYSLHNASDRSHVRAVVIDGEIGYTGGFGLADYWLGDGRAKDQWRETNVRFEGPAVMGLQAAFAAAWAECTGELIAGDMFFPKKGLRADGRGRDRGAVLLVADDGEHAGGTVHRPVDRECAEDALRRQLVLRPRRRLPEAAEAGARARRGRPHPHGEQGDRRQDDVVGGALTVRGAAPRGSARLRVPTDDDAREDVHRRRACGARSAR